MHIPKHGRPCGMVPLAIDNILNIHPGEDAMSQLDYEINKELGECYLFMGDLDKAEEYYRKAINSDSAQVAPYLGLATVAVQHGKLDEAMVLYSKAASIEESDKTLAGMGLVYMELGSHEDAYDHFSRALKLNAENMVALNCLVREGYHLNRLEDVIPALETSMHASSESSAIRVSLAGILMSLGRNDEAKEHLEGVLGTDPTNENARDLIASIAA